MKKWKQKLGKRAYHFADPCPVCPRGLKCDGHRETIKKTLARKYAPFPTPAVGF